MAIDPEGMRFVTALHGNGYQLVLLANDRIASEPMPVIGFLVYEWKLPRHGDKAKHALMVFPATAEDVYDDSSQGHLLIRPDGKVDKPNDRMWESFEDCKRDLAAQEGK